MDDQNQIDRDLPEPVRQIDTPQEREKKQYHLSLALFFFVSLYSFLHKIIVPFALSFTSLYPGPYTKLDAFFILPVALTWFLAYRPQHTKVISFLAGMTMVYGLLEIIEVSQGHYVGWLSFSRLLSSVPAAFLSLFFLITGNFKSSSAHVSLGVFSLILVHYFGGVFLDLRPITPQQISTIVAPPSRARIENVSCGAMEVSLKKTDSLTVFSEITIEACGFSPSTFRLQGSKVHLRNRSGKAVNVHLTYYKKNKMSTGWNVLLPDNGEVVKEVVLNKEEAAMLYSDSVASSGIVAVVQEPIEKEMYFSRSPVKIEVVDGI